MIKTLTLQTSAECFVEVTRQVEQAVAEAGCAQGVCLVYCPHTTAGLTINENADPDVVADMLLGLREAYPDRKAFRHFEGNSPAHLRASALGFSQLVPVQNGRLMLGRWQGIYLCEFDGPRTRTIVVKVMEG